MTTYIYLGDRFTDPLLKGKLCKAVIRNDKCVRGRLGTMLVSFDGTIQNVIARRLRKIKPVLTILFLSLLFSCQKNYTGCYECTTSYGRPSAKRIICSMTASEIMDYEVSNTDSTKITRCKLIK